MTHSIIAIDELRKIAHTHALAMATAESNGEDSEALHLKISQEFQRTHKPHLSDKQYTALYRTYNDMVLTALSNHFDPGSRIENPPVQVSSIKDGDEMFIPNLDSMQSERWDEYLSNVIEMAERCASEIAFLAKQGGDTTSRIHEMELEAIKFFTGHNITEDEIDKSFAVYRETISKAMEREANMHTELQEKDSEERYRQHLAYLISRTKSNGASRYFNQYVNRCREEAAVTYPKGAAAANKKDNARDGFLGMLGALFSFFR